MLPPANCANGINGVLTWDHQSSLACSSVTVNGSTLNTGSISTGSINTGNMNASGNVSANGSLAVGAAGLTIGGEGPVTSMGITTLNNLTNTAPCANGAALAKDANGGFSCITFSASSSPSSLTIPASCPSGLVLVPNGSGGVMCGGANSGTEPSLPASCPAGNVLVSNGNGGATCGPGSGNVPSSPAACPAGNLLVSDGNGGVTCGSTAQATPPSCPRGQLLASDGSGNLHCSVLQCRTVSSYAAAGFSPAMCNGDEFAMNGGGLTANQCSGEFGFIHTTIPWGVGYGSGWAVNGWGAAGPTNITWADSPTATVCSTSYATCCKFVPQ